jgi:hypothetical protein
MVEDANKHRRLNLMLIQELLWKLEDKINVILEGIADHEAELIRHRQNIDAYSARIDKLEARKARKLSSGGKK